MGHPYGSLGWEVQKYKDEHPGGRSLVARSLTRPTADETFDVGFMLGCEINGVGGSNRKQYELYYNLLTDVPEGYQYFRRIPRSSVKDYTRRDIQVIESAHAYNDEGVLDSSFVLLVVPYQRATLIVGK